METGQIIAFVCFIIVTIGPFIAYRIYTSKDHSRCIEDRLREDAKIISVDVETVGLKNEKCFRVSVLFDDSFEYISRKGTEMTDIHYFSYKINLPVSAKKDIINNAITSHQLKVGRPLDELQNCKKCNLLIKTYPCIYCECDGTDEQIDSQDDADCDINVNPDECFHETQVKKGGELFLRRGYLESIDKKGERTILSYNDISLVALNNWGYLKIKVNGTIYEYNIKDSREWVKYLNDAKHGCF